MLRACWLSFYWEFQTLCPSVLSYCSSNITKVSNLYVTLKVVLLFLQDFSLSEAAVEETWKLHVCLLLCSSDFVYPPTLIDSNLQGFVNSSSWWITIFLFHPVWAVQYYCVTTNKDNILCLALRCHPHPLPQLRQLSLFHLQLSPPSAMERIPRDCLLSAIYSVLPKHIYLIKEVNTHVFIKSSSPQSH